jgi:hypothetical protein
MAIKKLTIEMPEELFNRFFRVLIDRSETKRAPTFPQVNAAAQTALVEWLDKTEKRTSTEV